MVTIEGSFSSKNLKFSNLTTLSATLLRLSGIIFLRFVQVFSLERIAHDSSCKRTTAKKTTQNLDIAMSERSSNTPTSIWKRVVDGAKRVGSREELIQTGLDEDRLSHLERSLMSGTLKVRTAKEKPEIEKRSRAGTAEFTRRDDSNLSLRTKSPRPSSFYRK